MQVFKQVLQKKWFSGQIKCGKYWLHFLKKMTECLLVSGTMLGTELNTSGPSTVKQLPCWNVPEGP